ncbi:hypothetical protein [Zhenhengia sp.]
MVLGFLVFFIKTFQAYKKADLIGQLFYMLVLTILLYLLSTNMI